MALVPCRECGKEVSDKAEKCPNCGISTPSKQRRQIKLAITVAVILIVVAICAYGYHKVTQVFAPPPTTDSAGAPLPPAPKLQKYAPVKQQIIQHDYKDKVREMLDSGKSVREISKTTGLRKDEIRKIKKDKEAAEEAAAERAKK